MSSIDDLALRFKDFPGIGPRQARRFVYFLLTRNRSYLDELANLITQIKNEVKTCPKCQRFFGSTRAPECNICSDATRTSEILMIVEKDVDIDTIERSGAYRGRYFVLAGTIPILEKDPESRVHLRELTTHIRTLNSQKTLKEVVLALSVTPDGEHTTEYISAHLRSILGPESPVLVSHLARGLSTGSELEYADSDTLREAISHRTKE